MSPAISDHTENTASPDGTTATARQTPGDAHRQAAPEPDRVLVACPHCRTDLSVRRKRIGERVRCKGCTQSFFLPPALDRAATVNHLGDPAVPQSETSSADCSNRPIVTPNTRLLDEIARFVASYDLLRNSHEQLQRQIAKVETERDESDAKLVAATEELNAIRAQLGKFRRPTSSPWRWNVTHSASKLSALATST